MEFRDVKTRAVPHSDHGVHPVTRKRPVRSNAAGLGQRLLGLTP